jgi:8-oxo-dGTP pyrophosphatase MutT (NUDIX family)
MCGLVISRELMDPMRAHRHVGVYGICVADDQLLLIRKNAGPYRGRYDLPGGSLEPDESLVSALRREFEEEVGMPLASLKLARDFFVRRVRPDYTHEQHIALFYEVSVKIEARREIPSFDGQDSDGFSWVPITELTPRNSSPMVLQAVQWVNDREIPAGPKHYDDWVIPGG